MKLFAEDPQPTIALAEIESHAVRARAWLARALCAPSFPTELSIQVAGAVTFIEGLDYHYRSFVAHHEAIADYLALIEDVTGERSTEQALGHHGYFRRATHEELAHKDALHHEAVAYLNRLGQLYYFAKNRDCLAEVPITAELMTFRMKHTAHRSLDCPRNESADDHINQAIAFGFSIQVRNNAVLFQIKDGKDRKEFCLEEQHDAISRENTALLLSLFPLES